MAIETARARCNKEKRSFEETELLLRNPICNVDSKQSKINEVRHFIYFTLLTVNITYRIP